MTPVAQDVDLNLGNRKQRSKESRTRTARQTGNRFRHSEDGRSRCRQWVLVIKAEGHKRFPAIAQDRKENQR